MRGLALALMASTSAYAEVTTEHKLWIDASVRAEVMDALDVSVTQHLRTADGARRVGQVMPELELSYGFLDHLAVGAGVQTSGRWSWATDSVFSAKQHLMVRRRHA